MWWDVGGGGGAVVCVVCVVCVWCGVCVVWCVCVEKVIIQTSPLEFRILVKQKKWPTVCHVM